MASGGMTGGTGGVPFVVAIPCQMGRLIVVLTVRTLPSKYKRFTPARWLLDAPITAVVPSTETHDDAEFGLLV